jgi:uracil-DNA glycosylase
MEILNTIRKCRHCADTLPLEPRPIIQGDLGAKLLIIGQAPGIKAHETGIPWNDASGLRLRKWLEMSEEDFYNPNLVAILPIGFCYPGRAKSGDARPRKECFDLWHAKCLTALKNIELTLLIGNHAHARYLPNSPQLNSTEIIKNWRTYLPDRIPLPHPSPRNNIWLKKNSWFVTQELEEIRQEVSNRLR